MLAAITATDLLPAVLLEATFADGVLRVWSGATTLSWNGHSWLGVGTLGSITGIDEGNGIDARGITIGLSGIDASALAEALQNLKIGAPVVVYLGMFSSGSLIADPIIAWSGRMDQPTIDIGGSAATISIQCESRLLDMNTAVDRRYTLEDSQMDHPGDLALQFVSSLVDKTVFWGRLPSSQNNV